MSHRGVSEPRVLQLTAPGSFGGLETVVCQLSVGLVERGMRVGVVCRLDRTDDPGTHPFVDRLRREHLDVETIQLPHRAYLREVRAFTAVIDRFEADVVHTHGYHADVIGAWAARRAGVPRVATAHGFTGGGWQNRLYEGLQRRSYRSAMAVIAVSRPLAEELARDPSVASAVRHVRNTWVRRSDILGRAAAREELGLDSDEFVAGWVGRMSREKGPDVMVKAMQGGDTAGITTCMIGDGRLHEEVQRIARSGQGGPTVLPGAIEDAGRLFRAFDVLVLSSRTEGSPMVLLEAMDAEVPIVATHVGGIPDMVSPDEALIVPSEDPAGIREAVLSVHDDPAAARARARRAAERLEREFAPASWLEAHEAIYRDVIARHRASG